MFKYFCFIFFIFVFACEKNSTDSFEEIEKLCKQAKYNDAISSLKETLSNPRIEKEKKFKSLLKLGDIYKELNQNNIAAKYYEAYLKKERPSSDKQYYRILISIGDKYFILKKYKEANKYYEEALSLSFSLEQKSVIFLKLANNFLKQENFKTAIFYYDKAIKASKNDVYLNQKALFFKSLYLKFLKEKENTDQEINLLKDCVEKDNSSYYGVLCSFYLVDYLKKEGKKKSAREILDSLEDSFLSESLLEIKRK